ncbi:MAG: hypothetical protein H0W88_04325 [Parachlamydiaceae bacterium]|nr:hypothetical protein [Parachlamydiaceae bacterium]
MTNALTDADIYINQTVIGNTGFKNFVTHLHTRIAFNANFLQKLSELSNEVDKVFESLSVSIPNGDPNNSLIDHVFKTFHEDIIISVDLNHKAKRDLKERVADMKNYMIEILVFYHDTKNIIPDRVDFPPEVVDFLNKIPKQKMKRIQDEIALDNESFLDKIRHNAQVQDDKREVNVSKKTKKRLMKNLHRLI